MRINKLESILAMHLIFSVIFISILNNSMYPICISSLSENFDDFKINTLNWSNATVISDGYNGTYWNNDYSTSPAIAVDDNGTIHVVWSDSTNGRWGSDTEIMYANYTIAIGWSNATVISDGYNGTYWNNDYSTSPVIAVDNNGTIYVVWADETNGTWGIDQEIMYVSYIKGMGWSNATVISDGYNRTYWNSDYSRYPQIAVDKEGTVHVVWEDWTDGRWGFDDEIMYVNYTAKMGWSNATVISDGYKGIYWNNGYSNTPSIDTDNNGGLHVVWYDTTNGLWGSDFEIMYANYTAGSGWSNATVISDGYNGIYWNTGDSYYPEVAVENRGTIHVVWRDTTPGPWGGPFPDYEIMYVNYTATTGWSNATVISDGYNGTYWNNDTSEAPSIAVDSAGIVHVVWYDYTNGKWGTDIEIMYTRYTPGLGWSNATVISDGYNGVYWNTGASRSPSIAAENNGAVHVVWWDTTIGEWGNDWEIMYTYQVAIPFSPILNPILNIGSSIFLNWTHISMATIYYIYRNTSKIVSSSGLNPIKTTDFNYFMDTIMSPGTYFYVIAAGNTLGNSSISNCENITISPPPNPPFLYHLKGVENKIYLNWTNIPEAITYFIYRHTSEITNLSALIPIYRGIERNYTDVVLKSGTYFYVIIAGNNYGNSSLSNCENITISFGTKNGSNLTWILLVIIPPLFVISFLMLYKRQKKKKKTRSTTASNSSSRVILSEKRKK